MKANYLEFAVDSTQALERPPVMAKMKEYCGFERGKVAAAIK
jgi:hypothetical protein